MNRRRLHARLISEYLDARISAGLVPDVPGSPPPDSAATDFDELLDLARELADLDLGPPPTLGPRLLGRLPIAAAAEPAEPPTWHDRPGVILNRARWFLTRLPRWVPATMGAVTAIAAAILLLDLGFTRVTVVSAEEVLRRNETGLEAIVQPGQWLYRRWRVLTRDLAGQSSVPTDQIVSEWADGDDPAMVAGEGVRPDGRLLWRYVTVREDGAYRPHVYFTTEFPGPERASVYIRPTDDEIARTFEALPASERPGVNEDYRYLAAASYLPILGDRRFNLWALDVRSHPGSLFGAVGLEMEQIVDGNGRQAHRIRILRPVALAFRWEPSGARVTVGRSEVTKDISADRYLTLRATIETRYSDGLHIVVTYSSEEVRPIPAGSIDSPFELSVPPGTHVYRHSAAEVVTAIQKALAAAGRTGAGGGAGGNGEGQSHPAR